ncbi:hypothetical protein BN946_scf184845.g21 [Trametes cinnabarina]|uniref:Uncharacterized protein n=1 Tax=Pycnoporus cinnabarinus TaxID=5643 RepID=A0A060SA82_PYCCI|nr:hypothetical protein BN946_scf184845.g21 [Trametes cinnabarina]
MHEVQRLLQAASALSQVLRHAGVPHAFYGNVLTAVLSTAALADEISCIVEGGTAHPFRRVRQACAGNEDFAMVTSPWNNRCRLHVRYQRLIPAIDIEILVAGEEGPRRLDGATVMTMGGVPFLTVTEFIRAKVKSWTLHGRDQDARDILYAMTRYWNRVDLNRIPEQEMNDFAARYPAAAPSWKELKRKYGMS